MGTPGAKLSPLGTPDIDTMQLRASIRAPDTTMTPPLACLLSVASAHPSISTGKERDSESGNDYFEARYYSSAMGRFLSPDWSAKLEPVPYAKLDNPQSLNLYSYVLNNPLSRVDADGHDEKTTEKIVAAAKASEEAKATTSTDRTSAMGSSSSRVLTSAMNT